MAIPTFDGFRDVRDARHGILRKGVRRGVPAGSRQCATEACGTREKLPRVARAERTIYRMRGGIAPYLIPGENAPQSRDALTGSGKMSRRKRRRRPITSRAGICRPFRYIFRNVCEERESGERHMRHFARGFPGRRRRGECDGRIPIYGSVAEFKKKLTSS